HRTPAGGTRGGGQADRPARHRRAGRRLEPRGPPPTVRQGKRRQGRLDVLFANAGVLAVAPLGLITEEDFAKDFNINVKGLLFTVQMALSIFTDGGSIILNASIAASKALEARSVYGASKAAVRSFARGWTTELRHRRIRVNVSAPAR